MAIEIIPEQGFVPEKVRHTRGDWGKKFDRLKPNDSFPIPSEAVDRVRSAMKYWLEKSEYANTCRIIIEREAKNTHRVYLHKMR